LFYSDFFDSALFLRLQLDHFSSLHSQSQKKFKSDKITGLAFMVSDKKVLVFICYEKISYTEQIQEPMQNKMLSVLPEPLQSFLTNRV
jgi:hypothetical protein